MTFFGTHISFNCFNNDRIENAIMIKYFKSLYYIRSIIICTSWWYDQRVVLAAAVIREWGWCRERLGLENWKLRGLGLIKKLEIDRVWTRKLVRVVLKNIWAWEARPARHL